MNRAKSLFVTASIVLAMAFAFSYSSNDSGSAKGSFTDARDGQTYSTVKIGNKTWMAKNLNFNAEGSVCYNDQKSNCLTYGRLYDWVTAMDISKIYYDSVYSVNRKHKGICPSGWHLPNNAEWDQLYRYADGTKGVESPYDSPTAGWHLKATSGWDKEGWNDKGWNGQDTYGFAALPGGYVNSYGNSFDNGWSGNWWSATEYDSSRAYLRFLKYNSNDAEWHNSVKFIMFSVRCLKD
jgi:uncharacterized protein (TIGR02145 family)